MAHCFSALSMAITLVFPFDIVLNSRKQGWGKGGRGVMLFGVTVTGLLWPFARNANVNVLYRINSD